MEAAIANASREACLDALAHFMNETLEQIQARLTAAPATDEDAPSDV